MHLLRKTLAFIIAASFAFTVHAQQPLAKTLLWRISGKGLQKPSYLFGTMHLTDKRLFNFDDSVYNAIEATDGFAMEVNPDELVGYMINQAFDQLEKGKKVKSLLGDKEYVKYRPALEKKFGKPADDITTTDIIKEKHKWMGDYMKKGEAPTFVDAFLYSIAKKQGKWIGGVEDMSDQASIIDQMVDKTDIKYMLADDEDNADAKTGVNSIMETMINTYTNQDIAGIENITNAGTSAERRDMLLIRRNIKMARRIDSLAAFRTMFFAIGAAHLPGDSGVIQLLKARGFTVEPVLSTKKIAYGTYKVKEVETVWSEVKDDRGLYTVSMPGNAQSIKLYGVVDVKFMFDLTNLSGFYTMAGINPSTPKNKDSLYNGVAKRMFADKKITPKKITSNGIEGREFEGVVASTNMRVQVFINGKIVYMLIAYGMKKEAVSSPVAEKFFNSLAMHANVEIPQASTVFEDAVMGVRFNSPVELKLNAKLSSSVSGWKVTAFNGTDMATGSFIAFFSKEASAGSVITNDSVIYADFFDKMKAQYSGFVTRDTIIGGVPSIMAEGKNILQPTVHAKIMTTIAGNRNLLLMVLSDEEHLGNPALNNVFNSFRFVEHPSLPWQQYSIAGLSTWAPTSFRVEHTEGYKSPQYYAYDTTTSTSLFVFTDTLDKYTWAKTDSAFWSWQLSAYKFTDSIVSQTPVKNGTEKGIELLMKVNDSKNTYKRVRLLVNGNIMHRLYIMADRASMYGDNTDKFFTSFDAGAPGDNNFILQSKATVLINDLQHGDSATRAEAFSALHAAPFTADDLPLLHDALFKNYSTAWDSTSIYKNKAIGRALEKLADAKTVAFIKAQYNKNGTTNDEKAAFNGLALTTLAGIHTKESYDVMASLLLAKDVVKPASDYYFENNLRDSLALTTAIYPQLLQVAGDSVLGGQLARISIDLLDSNLITLQTIEPATQGFIACAKYHLTQLKEKKDDNHSYLLPSLFNVLCKLKTPEAIETVKGFLDVSDAYLRLDAAKALLKNGQQVPAAVLTGLAADVSTRNSLYQDLKDMDKASLFPTQYLTQQYFAEAAVYSAANDDDDEGEGAGRVAFLSKKTAKYKGKSYTFYLYKVTFKGEDEESSYLGIAGGYDSNNGKALEPDEELTGLYWKDKFDAKNITTQFQAFLKEQEDDAKADEEDAGN